MKVMNFVIGIGLLFTLISCGPAKIDLYEEIGSNETAFVIPLEGKSKDGQAKFDSIEFLESKKIAAKRIYIAQTEVSTGRWWWNYKYIPVDRVIKVDRRPVTFVWEDGAGLKVESKDSIGFKVGINASAYVSEEDTSVFLYNYPSGDMKKVLDENVKSKAIEILSREFARYDLEGGKNISKTPFPQGTPDVETDYDNDNKIIYIQKLPGARQQKGEIVDHTKKELIAYFKKVGVTLSTFGLTGGLTYEDKEIQTAINENFKSELEIKNRKNEKLAQDEINKKTISQADAERQSAENFAKAADARKKQVELEIALNLSEAAKIMAGKWNGGLPYLMTPNASGVLIDPKALIGLSAQHQPTK